MTVSYRPRNLSAGLAIIVGAGVVALLVPALWLSLGTMLFGILMLAIGGLVRDRQRPGIGVGVSVTGAIGILIAVLTPAAQGHDVSILLIAVSGLLGTSLLAFGVFPVRGEGSRLLVKTGSTFLFISVLASAVNQTAALTLFAATVGTILVWDLGEQSINIGQHLGRTADARSIEITHCMASVGVGVIAVITAEVVARMGTIDISISQFALLVTGLLFLTWALHE